MGLMTKEQYIESLRKLKPTVYMFGEKVGNVVDNPRLRAGIDATGADIVVTGCPGCEIQLIDSTTRHGRPVKVMHIMDLII